MAATQTILCGPAAPYDGSMIEFPAVRPGEDIVISATTYVTYLKCPEQAGGRLRGVYGEESRRSFSGGLGHRVFARHLRDGPIEAGDFDQVCREEIGSSMNAKLTGLGLRPSELRDVIAEVGELYNRFRSMRHEGFAGAEVSLEAEPAPGVVLRGSIDAVFDGDTGLRLVDWKTGSVPDAATDQLRFYALLWALQRDELPARVEALSVASGEQVAEVPTEPVVQATADAVAAMIDRIRSAWEDGGEPLERTAGPWCRYCPLLEGCSEGSAAVKVASGGVV